MGKSTTYRELVENIHTCAKSLKAMGVRENDKVTIAMPNCPQAIYMLYAVNLVGAIANMVHPLSAEKENTMKIMMIPGTRNVELIEKMKELGIEEATKIQEDAYNRYLETK